MNEHLLDLAVQDFINLNLKSDASKISLGKSPFPEISSAELANQVVAKNKSEKKLPTWFSTKGIYFPPALSIEQTSSETTAQFKSQLFGGNKCLDITVGFGVDAYYFSKNFKSVKGYEHQPVLSEITRHNMHLLGRDNVEIVCGDGLDFLKNTEETFDLIYTDPARRSTSGKVFKLSDCEPNITPDLPLILSKTKQLCIKTSPLLDLSAGLSSLSHVKEIYVISVKNECKELLWILDGSYSGEPNLHAITLNSSTKRFSTAHTALDAKNNLSTETVFKYLYEPDVALLKTGAFNQIGWRYGLQKLHRDSQLYLSNEINTEFPGRIFEINKTISARNLKESNKTQANVVVRNYPSTAEDLVKKYKIKPSKDNFLIFTQHSELGFLIYEAKILQHY